MNAQQQAEAKAVLDRFLADNPELEELSARLATFNIFRALKIEDAEIRHSNTLAWLLDPRGSHGLGDVVLRRVMSNILLGSGAEASGLSAAEVELLDFSDVEVRREWHHLDLLVIVQARDPVVVLFENKMGSGVSKKQLEKYYSDAKKEFPPPGCFLSSSPWRSVATRMRSSRPGLPTATPSFWGSSSGSEPSDIARLQHQWRRFSLTTSKPCGG